ncbi:predicted protein [Aspergillus terreus NIH2624]|uniref:Uncharacterized protein n=1 Tax=Aspergillus terreus (strain NIH 2624 / FGSC A1156) TaxID=341663 RepID=Q0CY42_ASPTN|nr:uncharacterized protein ATEG_01392 [Aspergillus terreus NIH2624]EAU38149.1 predicted protein [Aspergillus terreus NIH2624]
MAPKKSPPHAAFVEEYDEDAHAIVPDTRQVAKVAARRSRSDLRSLADPVLDLASDSGYSSRTAATVHSTQSAPSSGRNDFAAASAAAAAAAAAAVPSAATTTLKRADLDRVRSSRKDRTKERSPRPSRENDKMQVVYPPVTHHHQQQQQQPPQRHPSRRRESAQMRHYPGTCLECDQGLYHGPLDYSPAYYISQPSTPTVSSVHDYPPSIIQQDVPVSRPSARTGRSNSYHTNPRPMSFHGVAPNPMGGPVITPNQGPTTAPRSSSTTTARERSASRTRRRPSLSVYPQGPPMPDFECRRSPSTMMTRMRTTRMKTTSPSTWPRRLHRRPRRPAPASRRTPPTTATRTTTRSMPPPPLKYKAAPNIIQRRPDPPRKSVTAPAVSYDRRSSRSLDLSDLRDALPSEYGYHRSSRETIVPERNRRLRSTAYHPDGSTATRPSRVSVESSRRSRRAPTVYDYPASVSVGGSASGSAPADDIDEKQREAEEYQYQAASRAGKPPPSQPPAVLPLTEDALYKAKTERPGSESGSQKSRSSRGSAKPDEACNNNSIVMTMNGITMSIPHDTVGGKMISLRSGDTGAISLNIHNPHEHRRRPKKYLPAGSASGASEHSARREIEDVHRPRGDRRSDRASRRSSRSIYSGRS